jgi:hypothetical protein
MNFCGFMGDGFLTGGSKEDGFIVDVKISPGAVINEYILKYKYSEHR